MNLAYTVVNLTILKAENKSDAIMVYFLIISICLKYKDIFYFLEFEQY